MVNGHKNATYRPKGKKRMAPRINLKGTVDLVSPGHYPAAYRYFPRIDNLFKF